MKKSDAEKFFNNLAEKETDLQNALENLKPTDLSKSGRKEIIGRVESMIDKMEKMKARLQDDVPHKKAS